MIASPSMATITSPGCSRPRRPPSRGRPRSRRRPRPPRCRGGVRTSSVRSAMSEVDTPRKAWSGVTWPSPASQVLDDRPGAIDGDGEAEVLGVGHDGGVDATTWPAAFTSGPPELPGLMAASVWIRPSRATPSVCEVAVLGRHDAPGDRGLAAEVERVADGDHLVAHPQVVGRAELGGHQIVDALGLDHGQVVVGRAADQRGGVLRAVGEHDGDVAEVADHVGVGEHEPVGA